MQESDILALQTTLLWAAFALSAVFGAVAHRSRFCTLGAISDVMTMGDWTRMRMWVLAIAVAVLGFNGLVGLGWIEARHSLYATPTWRWLSGLVGGGLFGFGMALASGCGGRNLVRLGGGNLKSLVVLLVLGLSADATLKGLTAVLRMATVDKVAVQLPRGQDLPSLLAPVLGAPVPVVAAAMGGVLGLALIAWVLWRPEGRQAEVWLGGVGTGAVVVALWWLTGHLGHVAEHPVTLEETFLATNSRRMEALSLAAPVGYALDWLLYYSDAAKRLTVGIVSVAGLFSGAAVSALSSRSLRWEGFADPADLGHHLVGAMLMGVGGVTALGCSLGQGLSGVSTLSVGSLLVLVAIVAGGAAGLHYQTWRLTRN